MTRVPIPGGRDVTAALDEPDGEGVDACVVACPPHPQHGGSRSDRRLTAVSDGLCERGVACLRFDYGPWDEGRGERTDAANALQWAHERYDRVGLFGYSFGAAVALLVAAERDDLAALAVLAPPASLDDGSDVAAAVDSVTAPTLVVYGERDDTVDWAPVVERSRDADHVVESIEGDHHFVGQTDSVAGVIAPFLADHCAD